MHAVRVRDDVVPVAVPPAASDSTDADALPLGPRRVALHEDLSTLRYSANALSLRNGIAANDMPVNKVDAAPAVWKN